MPNSNRKERFERQRAKLISKAGVLFWRKGYLGTSMRDIARAFGCKPANIYHYFPNKEILLFEILKIQMELTVSPIRHLEKDESGDPIEQLRFLVDKHLRHVLKYRKSSKLLFDVGLDSLSPAKRKEVVALREEYNGILEKIIRRGIQRGYFPPNTDIKLAVWGIASMIVRTIIWFSPNGRMSVDEIADFLFHFALNGLRGDLRTRPFPEKNLSAKPPHSQFQTQEKTFAFEPLPGLSLPADIPNPKR